MRRSSILHEEIYSFSLFQVKIITHSTFSDNIPIGYGIYRIFYDYRLAFIIFPNDYLHHDSLIIFVFIIENAVVHFILAITSQSSIDEPTKRDLSEKTIMLKIIFDMSFE